MADTAGTTYTQDGRGMALSTPCGKDTFLLAGLSGHEGLSRLYEYRLDALVPDAKLAQVAWDSLLGKDACVVLNGPDGTTPARYFSGIVARVGQGEAAGGETQLTRFRLDLVPKLWLTTRRARSRTFHQQTVKEIVTAVLGDHSIAPSWLADGPDEPRDYCVQYRETDFNFISRLLEEEGIAYYFTHADGAHTMVVSAPPKEFPAAAPATARYSPSDGGNLADDVVHTWEKTQELRAEKYELRDHSFEKTGDPFTSQGTIAATVAVGAASHKLALGNTALELYDAPGEYAQRFDGIDKSGGEQAAEVGKIGTDGTRTAKIRMEEEAASAVTIQGGGGCRQFVAGCKFTLVASAMAHAAGDYALTAVQHVARQSDYLGDSGTSPFDYSNSFACIPAALPYRPARLTPKPVVHGTQTAVVVGNSGDEIFTDKYGRIKVQFHWDREGANDPNSSCWMRVGTPWAGAQWGAIHIPRVGQEVIVAFEEGDPDRPIVVGSVYNDALMPPYTLPDNKTQSGLKSRSTLGASAQNFNELRFEDKKDSEEIYFHAEKDFNRVVENNDTLIVGKLKKDKGDQSIEIFNNQTTKIGCSDADDGSQKITVFNSQTLSVGDPQAKDGSQTITVYKDLTETVKTGNVAKKVEKGNRAVEISMGNDSLAIKMGNQTTKLDLGASSTEAMQSITLKVGQNSIVIDQMGVTIKGMMVKVEGQIQTDIKGLMTTVGGDAMLTLKGGITMIN